MSQENLFAHTVPGSFYPPYISLNKQDDGRLLLTIRGERIGDAQGPAATFELNPEIADELGFALINWATSCDLPPSGWYCTRGRGHDGPCAAYAVGL